MIHEASCHIIIPPSRVGTYNIMGMGSEPPIPSDAELDEVFRDWKAKGRIFIARAAREENRDSLDAVTQVDMFRWGIKYAICEAKKIIDN